MVDWFIELGVYLLGVALAPIVGLLLIGFGLWGDRSKGRPRCPRCWYDMRGSLPRVECPECGHDAGVERRLYRNRRGRRRIAVGLLLILLAGYALTIIGGWYRQQPSIRRLTQRGHAAVQTTPTGPNWLVDHLPKRFARLFDRVTSVTLDGSAIDADLAECGNLGSLREVHGPTYLSRSSYEHFGEPPAWPPLDPPRAQMTDAGLAHLQGLSRLAYLDLSETQVSDTGLEHLKALSPLWGLDLSNTQVTDAGLVHLNRLSQLQYLGLSGTRVTDAVIVHLKALPQLRYVGLSRTQITDAVLVHLQEMPRLEALELSSTQVTDAGIVHLKALPRLTGLYLNDTQITDAAVVHLAELSKLETLWLFDSQVTAAGEERLRQALRSTRIVGPHDDWIKSAYYDVW